VGKVPRRRLFTGEQKRVWVGSRDECHTWWVWWFPLVRALIRQWCRCHTELL